MRNTRDDGDEILGIGRIESDKPKEKPKSKTYRVSAVPRRFSKAHQDWSAVDLGSEFSSRVGQMYPTHLAQANPVTCTKVFGRLMKEKGIGPEEMLAAMDLFFADPRNFQGVGEGVPLWIKFLRAFPYIQAQAKRSVAGDSFDWEKEAGNA